MANLQPHPRLHMVHDEAARVKVDFDPLTLIYGYCTAVESKIIRLKPFDTSLTNLAKAGSQPRLIRSMQDWSVASASQFHCPKLYVYSTRHASAPSRITLWQAGCFLQHISLNKGPNSVTTRRTAGQVHMHRAHRCATHKWSRWYFVASFLGSKPLNGQLSLLVISEVTSKGNQHSSLQLRVRPQTWPRAHTDTDRKQQDATAWLDNFHSPVHGRSIWLITGWQTER